MAFPEFLGFRLSADMLAGLQLLALMTQNPLSVVVRDAIEQELAREGLALIVRSEEQRAEDDARHPTNEGP